QIKELENDFKDIIEHIYDMPQVRLQELLSNIDDKEGILCQYQYRVLLQFEKAVFHMGFIHQYWFKLILAKMSSYIIIAQRVKSHTSKSLHYIDQTQTQNVYISTIQKKANKRIKLMSIAKTSIQITIAEGVMPELTKLLIQFIIKSLSNSENNKQYSLSNSVSCNLPKITNLEYYKPRDCSSKYLKLSTKENNN
ncbi:10179_t:CDS:2, partial [Gigaspora margarita]